MKATIYSTGLTLYIAQDLLISHIVSIVVVVKGGGQEFLFFETIKVRIFVIFVCLQNIWILNVWGRL